MEGVKINIFFKKLKNKADIELKNLNVGLELCVEI